MKETVKAVQDTGKVIEFVFLKSATTLTWAFDRGPWTHPFLHCAKNNCPSSVLYCYVVHTWVASTSTKFEIMEAQQRKKRIETRDLPVLKSWCHENSSVDASNDKEQWAPIPRNFFSARQRFTQAASRDPCTLARKQVEHTSPSPSHLILLYFPSRSKLVQDYKRLETSVFTS